MLTDREQLLKDLEAMGRPDICQVLISHDPNSLDVDSKKVLQDAADEIRRRGRPSAALVHGALVSVSTSGWGGITLPGEINTSADRH